MTNPVPTTSAAATPHAPTAHQALIDLLAGWLAPFPSDYTVIPPTEMPAPFHDLLVHHRHMTEVLQHHYSVPVHLTVQWSEASQTYYRRRILLTAGPTGPLVELGIVRLDLSYLPQSAQHEILAESTPLGRVLINHKILRRIQPHHYLRFDATSPILRLFNQNVPQPVYGRLGTIFCNEHPAIELLEIVTATPPLNHLTT